MHLQVFLYIFLDVDSHTTLILFTECPGWYRNTCEYMERTITEGCLPLILHLLLPKFTRSFIHTSYDFYMPYASRFTLCSCELDIYNSITQWYLTLRMCTLICSRDQYLYCIVFSLGRHIIGSHISSSSIISSPASLLDSISSCNLCF